jgi:hypothetical protein
MDIALALCTWRVRQFNPCNRFVRLLLVMDIRMRVQHGKAVCDVPGVLKANGKNRRTSTIQIPIASPASRAGCVVLSNAVAADVEAQNRAADAKAQRIARLFVGAAGLGIKPAIR